MVLVHVTVVSLHVQPRGQLYEGEVEVELGAELSRTSSTAASRDGRIVSGVSEGDDLQIGAATATVTGEREGPRGQPSSCRPTSRGGNLNLFENEFKIQ